MFTNIPRVPNNHLQVVAKGLLNRYLKENYIQSVVTVAFFIKRVTGIQVVNLTFKFYKHGSVNIRDTLLLYYQKLFQTHIERGLLGELQVRNAILHDLKLFRK